MIVPIREPEVALADLLAGISEDNLHREVGFEELAGDETL